MVRISHVITLAVDAALQGTCKDHAAQWQRGDRLASAPCATFALSIALAYVGAVHSRHSNAFALTGLCVGLCWCSALKAQQCLFNTPSP